MSMSRKCGWIGKISGEGGWVVRASKWNLYMGTTSGRVENVDW